MMHTLETMKEIKRRKRDMKIFLSVVFIVIGLFVLLFGWLLYFGFKL